MKSIRRKTTGESTSSKKYRQKKTFRYNYRINAGVRRVTVTHTDPDNM